jgi:hypothetical protein
LKERINYWILLAQLNPIPVAIGVGVLLLLIGLFLLQRRRARSPRRVRSSRTKTTSTKTQSDVAPGVKPQAAAGNSIPILPVVAPVVSAGTDKAAQPSPEADAKTSTPAPVIASEPADDPRRERIARVNEEARKLTSGAAYDETLIGSDDPETRKLVGAELLAAIVGRNLARRENARAAFIKHGYFDDATRDLRIADSENERAAAARRLSFVHDREATPHLMAALGDASPDVRRAAVEALMDLRDPAAIPALNTLMQTENDRKVPRTLLKHAIEACATAAPEQAPSGTATAFPPGNIPEPAPQPIETEREVIEL